MPGFFVRLSSIFLFSLMYAAHFLNYRLIIFFIKCCRMAAKNLFKVLMQIFDSSIANFHTPISGQGLSKISSVVKTQSGYVS